MQLCREKESDKTMLRGIDFQAKAWEFFPKLVSVMDVLAYDWYIDDVDMNYFKFQSGRYTGRKFKKVLADITELSFARIRRYPFGVSVREINCYEDWRQSACDLLILFYDGGIFEIYAKEEGLIHEIFKLCQKNNLEHIEFLTDENDARTHMYF